MNPPRPPEPALILPVAGISFVLLFLQLILIRMLSWTHGHHLAYVVISIALLGIGAGGALLAVWRHQVPSIAPQRLFAPALLLCAVTTAFLLLPARPLLAGIEVDLLHVDRSQWLRLAGLGLVFLLPFFFAAVALAIAFTVRAERIGGLYAANLLGSAAGALAAPAALTLLLPEQLLPLLGAAALLAALPARPHRAALLAAGLAVLVAAGLPGDLPRSPYKPLSYALQLPDARREGPFPHPRGRLELVSSPALRHAPDLSLRYTGTVPAPPHLFIDGDSAGVLLAADAQGGTILAETPRALPYIAGPVGHALLLAPGGTAAVNLARAFGARVTVVEPHPLAARRIRALAGPAAAVLTATPRLFLSRRPATGPPDLIVFPDIGQFGGPAGLQALGEDYLLTVEALHTALNRLAPGGRLALSVWLDEPLRHAPRSLDLVAEALRAHGVLNPAGHVLILRGWGSLTLLAGPAPVPPEAVAAAQAFAQAKGFDLVWPITGDPGARLHAGGRQDLDGMIAGLLGPGHAAFHTRTRFDLRAPRDRRPFFNQFLRPGDTGVDLDQLSISERGLVFLRALVLLLAAAVAVLVLGPLLALRTGAGARPFTLLYFAGLGAGFMIYETALIHRFILLLGDPVTATAAVITALLTGMSAGSGISRHWIPRPRLLAALPVAAILLQAAVLAGLDRYIGGLLMLPAPARFGAAMLIAGVPAAVMGMPFPLGIRHLARRAPDHIPWACGVDGALAVLAAPAAGWIAILFGFHRLSLAAGACYLLAALAALGGVRRAGADFPSAP